MAGLIYLSHVRTCLPNLSKEPNPGYPFVKAQPCLTCEVVKVRDKTLHDILQPLVAALRVDADYILSDIIDSKILQYWDRRGSGVGR